MNITRGFSILIFFLSVISLLVAQNHSIKGKITDANNKPIAFANIILKDSIQKIITGTTSSDKGTFTLPVSKGKYSLSAVCLGYKTYRQLISIKNDSIIPIILSEEIHHLGEVTIKAERPKVSFDLDKYSVIIENSMAATGNTIESLLTQLPGVWTTSDGNISINGISGAQIMINDKLIKLSGEALVAYLQTVRSETIAKIEIIAHPSVLYDAEGAGGIIHIITKRNQNAGWSGLVTAKIDKQKFEGGSPSLTLQYNKERFGTDISFSAEKSKWLLLSNQNAKNLLRNSEYTTFSSDTILDKNYSANANLYYDFSHQHKISLNLGFLHWEKSEYMGGVTDITNSNSSPITCTEFTQTTHQSMNNYSITLNDNLLLDSIGRKKITLLTDYVNQYQYNTHNQYRYTNIDNSNSVISNENPMNEMTNPYRIFSSEVKYSENNGKSSQFYAGLKFSNAWVGNNLNYYTDGRMNGLSEDSLGYSFHYSEQILSAYGLYNYKHNAWNFSGGLRAEYSSGKTNETTQSKTIMHAFPSVYFTYNITPRNSINLSFTQRIKRISYLNLLPRRYYTSRYDIIEGNPNLTHNIVNTIGCQYNIASKYNFSIDYQWCNNDISRYTSSEVINNISTTISSYVDGVKRQSLNCNLYLPYDITHWWSMVNQIGLSEDSYNFTTQDFHNFNYSLYTQQTFLLPLNIKAELLYRFVSSSKSAYVTSDPYHLLNLALQKSFLHDRFIIKAEANRLLYNQKMGFKTTSVDTEYSNKMYYTHLPFFAATISYTFHKGRTQKRQNIIHSDEQEKSRTY